MGERYLAGQETKGKNTTSSLRDTGKCGSGYIRRAGEVKDVPCLVLYNPFRCSEFIDGLLENEDG